MARLVRTAADTGTASDLDAARAQTGQDRVVFAGGQHRDGVQAGQRQRAGHVNAFAAGLGGHRTDPVHGPAHQLRRAG